MKKLVYLFSTLVCLSFCFTSCSDDDPDTPDVIELTIIPGQGINDLKIGDPGSKVATVLGDGFQRIVNVGGSGNATYNYYHPSKGLDIIFGQYDSGDYDIDTLPIDRFSLFEGFDGQTAEGIQIGSTMEEVNKAFGDPDDVQTIAYIYNIGLVFYYDDEDKVREIIIDEI